MFKIDLTRHGNLVGALKLFEYLQNKEVVAGVISQKDGEVARYMTNHELGTRYIPRRSFLRGTLAQHEKQFLDAQRKTIALALTQDTSRGEIDKRLGLLGSFIRNKIRERVRSGINPPLSPRTLKLKKNKTTPLINTGRFINSLTYEVIDK